MTVYKIWLCGHRAYWKPEQCETFHDDNSCVLIDDTRVIKIHDCCSAKNNTNSSSSKRSDNFYACQNFWKMLRKFKSVKNSSSITKSTPALNEIHHNNNYDHQDFQMQSPTSSRYAYSKNNEPTLDDDASLLDGTIHLSVSLPNGKEIQMPIDARTPMMDVLVKVATSNGISAGGMILKVPIDRPPGYLHYKPNLPIGKLGCTSLELVPRSAVCDRPRKQTPKLANLPFEPTIRIQIDLPKNQKTFLRISPQLHLSEVFRRVCEESCLFPSSAYELRAAKSVGIPLDLSRTVEEAGTVNFAVTSSSSCFHKSTSDILGALSKMPYEEKEKRKSKGFFGLFKRKQKAPAPPVPVEIQKTTFNGQAAVELRTPDKSRKSTGKERPLSTPSYLLAADETPNGNQSATSASNLQHDAAGKAKKRHAPPPPPAADVTGDQSATNFLPQKEQPIIETSVSAEKNYRLQQHVRQNSDSSSGYHGSSQPSPNPPVTNECGGATYRTVSGSEKSYKSNGSDDVSRAQKPKNVESVEHSAQKKKKAPLPPPAAPELMVSDVAEINVMSSPISQHSSLIKEDVLDSRCSSPTTVDDVDKTFEECIQHIEEKISAEEALAEKQLATVVTPLENATPLKKTTSGLNDSISGLNAHQIQSPSIESTGSGYMSPKTTDKPTDLDAELSKDTSPLDSSINVSDDSKIAYVTADSDISQQDNLSQEKEKEPATDRTRDETTDDTFRSPSNLSAVDSNTNDSISENVDANSVKKHTFPDDIMDNASSANADLAKKETRSSSIASTFSNISNIRSDSPSETASSKGEPTQKYISQHLKTQRPQQIDAHGQRSNIVVQDPKRDFYPSMTVKSFEEEYYTKKRSAGDDYVRTVRYGLSEAESEKDATPPRSKNVASKNAKIKTPPVTSPVDEGNARLLREYEKLQAVFADWQFRQKQHEAISKNGQKVSPEQMLSFRRLQDEMMAQHRYVQSLCSLVQEDEKNKNGPSDAAVSEVNKTAPASHSLAGSIADKLEIWRLKTDTLTAADTKIQSPEVPIADVVKTEQKSKTSTPIIKNEFQRQTRDIVRASHAPSGLLKKEENGDGQMRKHDRVVTFAEKGRPSDSGIDTSASVRPSALFGVKKQYVSPIVSPSPKPNLEPVMTRLTNMDETVRSNFSKEATPPIQPSSPMVQNDSASYRARPAKVMETPTTPSLPVPPPPPPPPPPVASCSTVQKLKPVDRSPKPVQGGDTRDELLYAIRSFGGTGGLKKTRNAQW